MNRLKEGIFARRLHKKKRRRLDFEKKLTGEAEPVIKGTNKRVVVVKSPDPFIFEEAIFVIREDFYRRNENDAQRVLEEAKRAAGDYVQYHARRGGGLRQKLKKPLYAAAGAAAAGLAWLAFHYAGVLF